MENSELPLVESVVSVGTRSWRMLCVRDQDALIARVNSEQELATFPYGLMLWASAIGLSERLVERAILLRGRRVLEIGAGVGLCGLVAASLGANITQTDYHPDALMVCARNASRNDIAGIDLRVGDWRSWPGKLTDFDLVIGADVLYERSLHDTLLDLLPRLAPEIWIADPLRPQALEFVARAEERGWSIQMDGHPVAWPDDPREIALFILRPSASSGSSPRSHAR